MQQIKGNARVILAITSESLAVSAIVLDVKRTAIYLLNQDTGLGTAFDRELSYSHHVHAVTSISNYAEFVCK